MGAQNLRRKNSIKQVTRAKSAWKPEAIRVKVARICAEGQLPEATRTEMVTRYSHKNVPKMMFCVRLQETHGVLRVDPQTLWNDKTWFRIDLGMKIQRTTTEVWFWYSLVATGHFLPTAFNETLPHLIQSVILHMKSCGLQGWESECWLDLAKGVRNAGWT